MIDEKELREFADTLISEPVSRSIEEIECAGEFIKVLIDKMQSLRSEHRALLVNEQNLREELVALKAAMGEPVAWINKDHTYVELSTPSTVYGSHTIPLYALTNKETK